MLWQYFGNFFSRNPAYAGQRTQRIDVHNMIKYFSNYKYIAINTI